MTAKIPLAFIVECFLYSILVKVGGMRVGQHHVHHAELKPSERAKEEEEFQTEK